MPEVGDTCFGFELLAELGRGSTGRVYLCRQHSLAGRVVVLKVGAGLSAESEKLARLAHPNIVPIYSYHEDGDLQAVCMPYRGPLTLGDVLDQLCREDLAALTGRSLYAVIRRCRERREQAVALPGPAGDSGDGSARSPAERADPGLSYVDAVLRIGRDIAAGLAFAHRHSVVHSDLKPANLLVDDDGRPQLIDFSVSYDRSPAARASRKLGGTWPYMSPEQIRAIRALKPEFDERSDLYGLGVILYELLTGRPAFDGTTDTSPAALERDLAARFRGPPPLRALNPGVPPAVAAIVGKCLAPDAADRYQTAGHLHEDLTRQLARQPLRFAPNPSGRELCGKWARRNRLVVAAVLALAAASAAAAGFAAYESRRAETAARLEFLAAVDPFAVDAREAEFALSVGDPAFSDRGLAAAHRALDRFGARADDRWFDRPGVNRLPPDVLVPAREAASGVMLLLADAYARRADGTSDPAERDGLFRLAGEWNHRAERGHPDPGSCRAVWVQRAHLARAAGDAAAEGHAAARAAELAPPSAREAVLEARQLMARGHNHTARRRLREAADRDPGHFWVWFRLGQCCANLADYREARAAYDIAVTHEPEFYGTYFNRGLVRFRLGDHAGAEADFDRVIAARPDWADPYQNRAVAREAGGRYKEALDDLGRALELGHPRTAAYLVRARVQDKFGDKAAAARDLAAAMTTEPTDERGWMSRGLARMRTDPAGAEADFARALRRRPDSQAALQALAHVLSRQGKVRDAAAALTRRIGVSPDAPDAWSGRGVLLARLNDRDAALADAREALRLSNEPRTLYQVAGIYALTSRTHPDDRRETFALLAAALRGGFGFEHLDGDRDLDPVRADPEFKKTVDAARDARGKRGGPQQVGTNR